MLANKESVMICGYCRTPVIFDKRDYTKIVTQEHGEAYYHGNPVHVGSCAFNAVTGGIDAEIRRHNHYHVPNNLVFPCGSLGESVQGQLYLDE